MFDVYQADGGMIMKVAPDKVLPHIPSAFAMDHQSVGMPFDLQHCMALAALGFDPPSPILYDGYCWPRDRSLAPMPFEHQYDTARFLTVNPHSYCLNGIGTSKTLASAWAADYLMTQGVVRKCVIGCPLSTLERVWADTIYFHLQHRTHAVVHGSKAQRRKQLARDVDFYIINHDGFEVMEAELREREDIDLALIDEVAAFRNSRTNMYKSLHALLWETRKRPMPWIWGLTGAPRPNSPTDAYGQCKLITPKTVPKYFAQWRSLTMNKVGLYSWIERPEANNMVYSVMKPAIRYSREECMDLPPELYTTHDVTMSKDQALHYKKMMTEMATEIKEQKIRAVNEGVKRSKLVQIACGVVYDIDGNGVEVDPGSRVNDLLELIEQCAEKVIVYVPFTQVTHMLYKHISKYWSAAIVYGAVPKNQRDKIFDDFQKRPDPSVLIAHPECMSHGLTLTESSTIIWYAPVDSNDIFEQACGRITRAGQKFTANIRMLSGCAAERAMYKRLQERKSLQGLLLDMVARGELNI